MRSRTELVTTTFIDSEEDETETDDSEEDWKPDTSSRSSGSGKQQQQNKTKLQRGKRKSNNLTKNSQSTSSVVKKRKIETTTFESEPDCDDGDDYDNNHYNSTNNSSGIGITNYCQQNVATFQNMINTNVVLKKDKPLSQKVVAEQSMPDKSGIFQLYLYKKDLNKDYRTSPNLCLWRRDGSSLLQKYIRIKTPNSEEFIFTSSSVYSSWDERRRKDFVILAVKCLEENNRRVTILNISDLHALAEDVIRQKQLKIENVEDDEQDDDSTDDEVVTFDSQDDEDDDDDEDNNDGGGSCNDYDGNNDDDDDDDDIKDHKDHPDSEQNKNNKNKTRSLNDDVCSNENTK